MTALLTPLERALLQRFHERYQDIDFPHPDAFRVAQRTNTGAGRYTYFSHDGFLKAYDGHFYLGQFSQLDMAGMDAGATYWLELEDGKVLYLEIAVNGDESWDGVERSWELCDPDTGEFPDASGE